MMIHIDGAMHSGSGTILRYAVALATLVGKPLHMVNIRDRRDKPGLRRQHLEALRACCALSSGSLEGDEVGSREIRYIPGKIAGGDYFAWDIGTAGSATMLCYTVLPLIILRAAPCTFSVTGGLFQDHAPTALHMQNVLFPLLRKMGILATLDIARPGYVPQGGGRIDVRVKRLEGSLKPLRLLRQGAFREIRGVALASHLQKEKVAERMAQESQRLLENRGYRCRIELIEDRSSVQPGAALLLWAESDGCILGADLAGKRGRRSEAIAEKTVGNLLEDMKTGATVDRFTADQLILFAALAGGRTEYRIPGVTDHVESNAWLIKEILGCRVEILDNVIRIDGVGFHPAGP